VLLDAVAHAQRQQELEGSCACQEGFRLGKISLPEETLKCVHPGSCLCPSNCLPCGMLHAGHSASLRGSRSVPCAHGMCAVQDAVQGCLEM
jgi:hypothetical protein